MPSRPSTRGLLIALWLAFAAGMSALGSLVPPVQGNETPEPGPLMVGDQGSYVRSAYGADGSRDGPALDFVRFRYADDHSVLNEAVWMPVHVLGYDSHGADPIDLFFDGDGRVHAWTRHEARSSEGNEAAGAIARDARSMSRAVTAFTAAEAPRDPLESFLQCLLRQPGSTEAPADCRQPMGEPVAAKLGSQVVSRVSFEAPTASYAWYGVDVSVPVRIAIARPSGGFDVATLTKFERGTAPAVLEREQGPELVWTDRPAFGLDEAGVDHPYPFTTAFAFARATTWDGLETFLDHHVEAALQSASFERTAEPSEIRFTWEFSVVGDGQRMTLCSIMHRWSSAAARLEGTKGAGWVHVLENPTGDVTHSVELCGQDRSDPVPPSHLLPKRAPTVASLQAVWKEHARTFGGPAGPVDWSMGSLCRDAACRAVDTRYTIGTQQETHVGHLEGGIQTGSQEAQKATLTLGALGEPIQYQTLSRRSHASRLGAPSLAEAEPPSPVVAADPAGPFAAPDVLRATGVLGTLLVVLWLLREWVTAAWWRLEAGLRPAVSHPRRQALHALVTAEPGIHHEELLRRWAGPRGSFEHHVARLVKDEVLVRVRGSRYTCYFVRGMTDRREMAAQPLLKSAGALSILRNLGAEPARPIEVARRAGVHRQAVFYHAGRLESAGLVVKGPGGTLQVTPLGRSAAVASPSDAR